VLAEPQSPSQPPQVPPRAGSSRLHRLQGASTPSGSSSVSTPKGSPPPHIFPLSPHSPPPLGDPRLEPCFEMRVLPSMEPLRRGCSMHWSLWWGVTGRWSHQHRSTSILPFTFRSLPLRCKSGSSSLMISSLSLGILRWQAGCCSLHRRLEPN
jgi:hypothetical protein